MRQCGTVLYLAFRQRLVLMTSPEVPFQPKLFSDVAVDITCACLLLSVSNVTFARFSQEKPVVPGVFLVWIQCRALRHMLPLPCSTGISKWFGERALLTIDFSFFAGVLVKWFTALASPQLGIRQLYPWSGWGVCHVCKWSLASAQSRVWTLRRFSVGYSWHSWSPDVHHLIQPVL